MVTDWPARLFWIGLLIACVAVTLWLIRWGWVRRARRYADQPTLDRIVASGDVLANGRYLGSALAGQWLERITAARLGSPSTCELILNDASLSFDRGGHGDFTVPRAAIVAVRTDRGLLGEVYGPDGIVVITWLWGEVAVDSGFRADPVTQHARVLAGLAQYREPTHTSIQGEDS